MIFVQRIDEPEVLRVSAAQWLSELQLALTELERLEADPDASDNDKKRAIKNFEKAQGRYRHRQVKNSLVHMFHGKCAYCESKVTLVTYGQIEHFYPKSRYVDRTFQWCNLLLSCDLCNDAQHKGKDFPCDGDGSPLLIDPTDAVPEDHLLFSWDGAAGLAWAYGKDTRGKTTVETFDLNGARGRQALIKNRSDHVRTLMTLLKFAERGDDDARSLLRDACNSDAPYAAFARRFVSRDFLETL
jgi:uncharacterized protein (TIGR02646 family)